MRNFDMTPLDLIHPYWIRKYHLDSLKGEVKTVPARSLLGPWRLGMFAKMVYISLRDTRPVLARRVYRESMRCSNPLWKEYGKEKEKNRRRTFFKVFNDLIDTFSAGEFDPDVSVVPVGCERHIIDGEHRVSTLSFFNKDVTICEFNVTGIYNLNYRFYKDRGMSDYCIDITVHEAVPLLEGLRALCLWPGTSVDLSTLGKVLYFRSFRTGPKACSRLRSAIDLLWAGEALKGRTSFVFYLPSDSGHAMDLGGGGQMVVGPEDVVRVSNLVLTTEGKMGWLHGGGIACRMLAPVEMFWDKLRADCRYLWLRMKVMAGEWDNKLWISLYGFLISLWKKHKKD